MTIEAPTDLPPDKTSENSENRHSKMRVGRDTLIVAAGVMISMSAGINLWQSILYVREGIRYLEQKLNHHEENS